MIALCAFYLLLGAYSSWAVSPVNDEPAHLVAGIHIWRTGRYDLYEVNPPLVKQLAAVPAIILGYPGPDSLFDATETIYRTEFGRGRQFFDVDPARAIRLIFYGRLICLPLGLIGLLTVVRWATSLYGNSAGYFAGLLWCVSPTMLGHAPLIVADSAATSLGVLASYAFWRFLQRPDWRNTLFMGLSFGFTLLTKTFWIELFLLWPLLLLAWQVTSHKNEPKGGAEHDRADPKYLPWLRLAVVFALAVAVLNLGYGFSGFGTRLRDFEFHSSALNGKPAESFADNLEPANRFCGSWLGEIPIPFPADFIRGIDIQRRDFEIYPSGYLRGTFRVNGWWYYYLYAVGVKESLGILLLITTAVVLTLVSSSARRQLRDELILVAPAVAIFVLVSSQTRMNHYFRYVLPVLPYLWIFAAKVMAPGFGGSPLMRFWGLSLIGWALFSSLSVFPYTIGYFNELAGGPANGWRHLSSRNTDWSQGMFALKRWQERYPERRPLYLAPGGQNLNPRTFGIEYLAMHPDMRGPNVGAFHGIEEGPVPGWHVISTSEIQEATYRYLRELEPRECIVGCYLVYYVTAQEAAALRNAPADVTMPPRTLNNP